MTKRLSVSRRRARQAEIRRLERLLRKLAKVI